MLNLWVMIIILVDFVYLYAKENGIISGGFLALVHGMLITMKLTNLITLEAAFGASARVLNAVQRAFDEVINIL